MNNPCLLPYVLFGRSDVDTIIGRIMGILEAGMPEGSQLEAVKRLVKATVHEYANNGFNSQREALLDQEGDMATFLGKQLPYLKAMWEVSKNN